MKIRTFDFMANDGELVIVQFTNEQIEKGDLRAHIEYMKEEGYTFMGGRKIKYCLSLYFPIYNRYIICK